MKRSWDWSCAPLLAVLIGMGACQIDRNVATHDETPDAGAPRVFDPPIANLGAPGWQQSSEPWDVTDYRTNFGMSVWSRDGRVFAMLNTDYDSPEDDLFYLRIRVAYNDGEGWLPWLDVLPDPHPVLFNRIRGASGGLLLGFGYPTEVVTRLDPQGTWAPYAVGAEDVFVVSDQLAYAVQSGRLIVFNGQRWAPDFAELPHDVNRIWANADVLFGLCDYGIIVSLEDDVWTVHEIPTLDDFTAIWGFARDDVWVATRGGSAGSLRTGLLHFDGASWEEVPWVDPRPATHRYRIDGMWGADGELFFYSAPHVNNHVSSLLVRTDGQTFDVLANWGCYDVDESMCPWAMQIRDLWGNSPEEVFLAVSELLPRAPGVAPSEQAYLLWFDGSEFHRL